MAMTSSNIHKVISSEISQGAESRTKLLEELEQLLEGRAVVSYFTSFVHNNGSVHDDDCDMLQSVLQHVDASKGLALIISTPGGDGLAAERIANICRTYSGTGDFWAIVPGKAKSAGTIVTMGASKIYMAGASELGPVDPQIFRTENGVTKAFSADALVASYEALMDEASKTQGPLEPYLLQLQKHDHREIIQFRTLTDLAKSIAVKLLKSGMMNGLENDQISKNIDIFLNPKAGTLSHGRAIYDHEAENCGLAIERIDVKSDLWSKLYELYVRTDSFVCMHAAKAVESKEESFYVTAIHR